MRILIGIFLFFLFIPSVSAYVNYSTFIDTGDGDYSVTITDTNISWSDGGRNDDGVIYKLLDTNITANQNFTANISVNMITGNADDFHFGYANCTTDNPDTCTGYALTYINIDGGGTAFSFKARTESGDGSYESTPVKNTQYWYNLSRYGGNFSVQAYSDSGMTTPVGGPSYKTGHTTGLTHFYVFDPDGSGGGDNTSTGTIHLLDSATGLDEVGGSPVYEWNDNLTALYRFEDADGQNTLADETSKNDATLTGTNTNFQDVGLFGNTFSFDGSDYFDINQTIAFGPSFSICTNFNTSVASGVFIGSGTATQLIQMVLHNTDNSIRFEKGNGGGWGTALQTSTGVYSDNTWTQTCIISDSTKGNELEIWVDGSNLTEGDNPENPGSFTLRIGASQTPGNYFIGQLDDYAVFDDAISRPSGGSCITEADNSTQYCKLYNSDGSLDAYRTCVSNCGGTDDNFSISYPTNGTTITDLDNITFTFTTNYDPTDKINISVDDVLWATIDAGSGDTNYSNTSFGEGTFNITANVTNSTGGILTDSIIIIVNRTYQNLLYPLNNNYTNNGTVNFSAYCNGSNNTVINAWFVINGTEYANTSAVTINTLWSREIILPTFNRQYDYYVKCEYAAGGVGSWSNANESSSNRTLYWVTEFELAYPSDGLFLGDVNTVTLSVNITQNSSSIDMVYFIINGGTYYQNDSSCTESVICNYTLTITTSPSNWTAIVESGGVNTTTASVWEFRTLLPPADCTAAGPTANQWIAVRINVTDEKDFDDMIEGVIIGFDLRTTHSGVEYTHSFINSSATSGYVDICLDIDFDNRSSDWDLFAHSGDTWPIGNYYLRDHALSNGTTEYTNISLLNSTYYTETTIFLVNGRGVQAEDYYIVLMKYDYDNSEWKPLRMLQTNWEGKGTFYIEQDITFYSFEIYNEDFNYEETIYNYVFTATESTIKMAVDVFAYYTRSVYSGNIDYSCNYNESTEILTCGLTDNNNPVVVTNSSLRVWLVDAVSSTLNCSNFTTSTSFNITCELSNSSVWWYTFKVETAPFPQIILDQGLIGDVPESGYGIVGVMAAAVLILVFGLIGFSIPGKMGVVLVPVMVFIGYALTSIMGLISNIRYDTITYLAILSLITAWSLNKK